VTKIGRWSKVNGELLWLRYLGITSACMGYVECTQDSKLPKVNDYSTYSARSSSCRCQWEKIPAMSVGNSIRHMESLQGFYIFVLAGPLAEKDVTGVDGQSMKPDTFKWEMHTFWKELSKAGVDTASLKIFKTTLGALWTGCSGWMQDNGDVVRIKGYT